MNSNLEVHKYTGKFKDDFEYTCMTRNLKFIPEICSRSRQASDSSAIHDNKQQKLNQIDNHIQSSKPISNTHHKGKAVNKLNKLSIAHVEVDTELSSVENMEQQPKTYKIKESYDYYKPKITVEMDNPESIETVTEIHIKGWKVEKPIMEALNVCLPYIERLNTIK